MARNQAAALRLQRASTVTSAQNLFRVATYVLAAVGTLMGGFFLSVNPLLTLLVAAVLCGWSEVDGLCGNSHVCALTPLRVTDPQHRLWRKAVGAYTAGGIFTASCVGASLGLIGLVANAGVKPIFAVIAVFALVLLVRELGWIEFPLPQVHRQTQKMWAFEFGFVPAAAMWGSHIGLGFATVVKHGGFFVVVAFALTLGPIFGALLMAVYWLGRTLPIWATPVLTPTRVDAQRLDELVSAPEVAYRHIAAAGLLCAGAVALMLVWQF